MAELPTGTVTFLFTDIEGSTRLLEELGTDRYELLQDEHAAILRGAIEGGGGTIVRVEGDAFFAAFPTPAGALRAAVSAQRDLTAHPWPEDAAFRVRMGLHSGEGRLGGGDYIGLDPNRAARIAAAAHGGQVVISDATRALVEHQLLDGVALRDLGVHRLKDIAHAEHLFDLVIDGLPSDFPALKTLDARPNNLPLQLTSFVGRQAEIAEAVRLMGQNRLVTLTGPGGTGKTRLALAVGTELLSSFPDGVFLVELAALVDPGQVCPTICEVLGVREEPGRDLIDTLVNRLMGQELLLILDNFEHLLEAVPVVGEVLRRVGAVRILATSRTPLGLYGEQELPVPPLARPDPLDLPEPEVLSRSEAVALFLDRAREARPSFQVTDENSAAVAEICARLDGLPLAIELAASRINVLSPQAILSRLDRRLDLLTGGARNVPERQRTLRGAIDWSYDLLEKPERLLFARLSAFAGGADLEAAEAVCNPDGDLEVATLDGLASLVDTGLVRRAETTGDPRFGMLETIREYARERLDADWDADETRRRHANYFLELAEASERDITAEDHAGLQRLDLEHDNIQAAFRWTIENGEAERGMVAAATIWRFWLFRGQLGIGQAWLDRLLAVPGERTEARARAHEAAGSLAYWQADLPKTERHYEDALAIYRDLGDRAGIARALYDLAFVPYIRRSGYAGSIPRLREAVDLFQDVGDEESAAKARRDIPYFMMLSGDLDDAVPLLEEALAAARETGDIFQVMDNLFRVAEGRRLLGDMENARSAALEALDIVEGGDIEGGIAAVLQLLSSVERAAGRPQRAMRLYGAAQSIVDALGGDSFPATVEDPVEESRTVIGDGPTEDALAEGRAMTRAEAVAYARTSGR
jgi:predicted ATPase/class 3 adenylate cyclase